MVFEPDTFFKKYFGADSEEATRTLGLGGVPTLWLGYLKRFRETHKRSPKSRMEVYAALDLSQPQIEDAEKERLKSIDSIGRKGSRPKGYSDSYLEPSGSFVKEILLKQYPQARAGLPENLNGEHRRVCMRRSWMYKMLTRGQGLALYYVQSPKDEDVFVRLSDAGRYVMKNVRDGVNFSDIRVYRLRSLR